MQVEHSDQQADNKPEFIEHQNEHKTLNHHSLYYTFTERYFTTYQNEKQYLHRHSNGLYLIRCKVETLPSRAVQIRDVLKVSEVKGKRKRGGSKVYKDTVIVQIVCEGGQIVPVYCLVQGVILQKNQRLSIDNIDRPQGYIAVINPNKKWRPQTAEYKQIFLPHQGK